MSSIKKAFRDDGKLYDTMVVVAQLVRALDCGSRGRGFESPQPPHKILADGTAESWFIVVWSGFFAWGNFWYNFVSPISNQPSLAPSSNG